MTMMLTKYFDLTTEQETLFRKAEECYTTLNAQVNVISRKDIQHLQERHFLHALATAKFIDFKPGAKILDIGTGGGFPGIPLAIFYPEVQFTLVDSIAKKIRVVEEVATTLGLKNVQAQWSRAEQLKGSFDFIVTRAVAPSLKIYRWSSKLLAKKDQHSLPNGWICLKGGDLTAEIAELQKVQPKLSFTEEALSDYFQEPFFETKKIVYFS